VYGCEAYAKNAICDVVMDDLESEKAPS